MKNPLTPAGIEPATFRIVIQHLNHFATAVPQIIPRVTFYYKSILTLFKKEIAGKVLHTFLFQTVRNFLAIW